MFEEVAEKRAKDQRIARGQHGQHLAEAFLQQKGFRTVECNVRSRHGEIDLIMQDGKTLVFVEVKARISDRKGSALQAVTLQKQRKISRLALLYLQKHHWLHQPARFDVVAITLCTPPQIQWVRNAFDLSL